MISLFLEGVASSVLPCSLTLLVPALAVALASRTESTAGLVGYGASVVGFSWLRFSDRADELPRLTIAGLLAVGAIVLVLPVIRRLDVVSALGGLLIGIAAAALWEPCDGVAFASLLEGLSGRAGGGMALFALHLIGVLAPMIGVGFVLHHVPDALTVPLRPVMLVTGVATLAALSFTVAIGQQHQILARLAELSA